LLDAQPELAVLPSLLLEYFEQQETLAGRQHLSEPAEAAVLQCPVRRIVGGVLASRLDWDPDVVTQQIVRAVADFHGKPWFDCLRIAWRDEANQIQESFAELRLLFTISDPKCTKHELALVRWFADAKAAADDVLVKFRAERLQWASAPAGPRHAASRALPSRLRGWYQVVAYDTIVRKEYIVPDFCDKRSITFYKSPFKKM